MESLMSRASQHARRIAVGVLLIALGGCGGGNSQEEQDGPPSITADEANQQYHEEAANWDLPAGWKWPAKPYSGKGPDGVRAVYSTEIGQVDATSYWFCAWSRASIDADTTEDRQVALDHVLRVRETPFYQIGLVNTEPIDAVLAAAEAGDLSKLASDAELNCPEGSQGS